MKIIYNGHIYEHFNYKNPIVGGKGDHLKKYDEKEMKLGKKIEKEHIGKNKSLTQKQISAVTTDIARDHLAEFPNYYTELEKMEERLSEEQASEN